MYMVLFLLGFILAICLLAYASLQVAELGKRTEQFGNNLKEHYSKPLKTLDNEEHSEKETVKKEGNNLKDVANAKL